MYYMFDLMLTDTGPVDSVLWLFQARSMDARYAVTLPSLSSHYV